MNHDAAFKVIYIENTCHGDVTLENILVVCEFEDDAPSGTSTKEWLRSSSVSNSFRWSATGVAA